MGVFNPLMNLPECCIECPLEIKEELKIGSIEGSVLVKTIYSCCCKPEDIKDGWISFREASKCRQKWCPLKEQEEMPEVVKCKDCIHRPTHTDGEYGARDIEFPDEICPCQCEDPWYNYVPNDDWYCGSGERKNDEQNQAMEQMEKRQQEQQNI